MKTISSKLGIAISTLLLATHTVTAADMDDIAKEVCECGREANNFANRQMEKLNQGASIQEIMAAQEEAMSIMERVEPCYAKLEQKYPHIAADTKKQDEVMQRVRQICPNPIFGGANDQPKL